MTEELHNDFKEFEKAYKRLSCSIQKAFNMRNSDTAELAPVIHAKWDTGYRFPDGEYWRCSNCGELIKVKIPMKYCNNCGARMDKE